MHIAHMHISNVQASLQLGAMLLKKWLQRQCAVIDSALRMGRASCSAVCEGSVKRDSSSQLERLVCTPPTMDLILSQPLLSCLNCGICETLFAWRSQEHRNNQVAWPVSSQVTSCCWWWCKRWSEFSLTVLTSSQHSQKLAFALLLAVASAHAR